MNASCQTKNRQPRIILYRILGNDIPLRHGRRQTYNNLKFILQNEPNITNCQKKWLLNRIFDRKNEEKIVKLLDKYKQSYIRIPFIHEEYKCCGKIHIPENIVSKVKTHISTVQPADLKKFLYITNLNSARNIALADGKLLADWILPLDGNCCFTKSGLLDMINKLSLEKSIDKYLLIPMYRLQSNKRYFNFTRRGHKEQEPQIIFGKKCNFKFDESFIYGFSPKVELLQRLNFGLSFTRYGITVTDKKIKYGYVLRLSSGIKFPDKFMLVRLALRNEAFSVLIKKVDKYISAS